MANPKDAIRRLVKQHQSMRLTEAEKLDRIARTQQAARRAGQPVRIQKAPPSPTP